MDKNFVSRFLKGSLSTSVGTFATIGLQFVIITLIAREVPRELLGIYFLILAIMQFFKIVSGMGLDLTLVKFISGQEKDDQGDIVSVILITRLLALLITGIVVYLTGSLILPLFGEGTEAYLIYIPFLFSLASLRELFFNLMQGLRLYNKYAIVQIASAILKLGLVLYFLNNLTVANLLIIELVMLGVSLIIQIIIIPFKEMKLIKTKFNKELFSKIVRFGMPLYYTNLLVVGHEKSSVFLIAYFLNPISITAYEIALKIPDGFSRLFRSFIIVYFPSLSELFSQGHIDDAKKVMNKSLVLFSSAIVGLVLISFLFAEEIVGLVFSEKYLDVSFAFALLMLNIYLRVMANILGYGIVGAGNSSASAKVNTIAIIVNITASLLLIPRFGYLGAIYSVILMNAISQISYLVFLWRADIAPQTTYLRPLFFLIVLAGLSTFFNIDSFLIRILFVLLYAVLCFSFVKDVRQLLAVVLHQVQKRMWQTKPVQT
jgi:O-antigen/teichoic acid export membrane protein